jgi:hypothetical protein
VRTTLELDDDVLQAARAMAAAESRSLGRVISELARRGLLPPDPHAGAEDGFPVFRVPAGAPPITDRMVSEVLEEI